MLRAGYTPTGLPRFHLETAPAGDAPRGVRLSGCLQRPWRACGPGRSVPCCALTGLVIFRAMAARYTPPVKAAVQTRYGRAEVVLISEVAKPATRFARDHAGERELPGGRSQYRGFALCPRAHQGSQDPQRAGRPGLRRNRRYRLSGGPAVEEPGRHRDRGCDTGHMELVKGLGADKVVD